LRTASILHYLVQRYTVDLAVFRQPAAPDPARLLPSGLVRRVFVVDLPSNSPGLAARSLRNAARLARSMPPLVDRFSGFQSRIAESVAACRYSVGIVEHFWCAPYWEQLAPVCGRTVLNLHNVESSLHARCAKTESGPARFAHRMFQAASLDLERQWLPRYSQVLTASETDACLVRSIAPSVHAVVYPNAIPLPAPPPAPDEAEVIVFSGNMEYHPNRTAVRFFRREVWPLLRAQHPALLWRLVGKNPLAIKEFTSGDPRIEVLGPVDDAVREIARARIAVVPLLAGSGTRLKILEAWAAGVPVVSTAIGAEGLPVRDGEHLLIADSPSAFAACVSRLLACSTLSKRLGDAGRSLLEKEFTWEAAWKKLDL
jgi:hypothetical protein